MQILILSLVAALAFVLLDLIWFYFAGGFFKSEIGSIARLTSEGEWNLRYGPAVLVYLLMGLGLTVFVYLQAQDFWWAVLLGGLFGLVGYGLYDLTNLATLSDWTVKFVLVDMLWGTFLCATVSGLTYLLGRSMF